MSLLCVLRLTTDLTCACSQAVEQLLEVEDRRKEGAYGPSTMAIGVARLQVCVLLLCCSS